MKLSILDYGPDAMTGEIRPLRSPDEPACDSAEIALSAKWWGGNPLAQDFSVRAALADAPDRPLAIWSGSMADWGTAEGGFAAAEPRTWGPAGWAQLDALCTAFERERGPGHGVLLRPHAAHALSDAPSCTRFLRAWRERGFSLLLDPAAMIRGTMLSAAADHFERILSALGPLPGVAGVLLTNLEEGPEPGGPVYTCPVHHRHGVLQVDAIVEAVRRHVPREVPLVLLDSDVEGQRAALADLLRRS